MSRRIPRRDRCYLAYKRMAKLTAAQASEAWQELAIELDCLGSVDIPKFDDLLAAIRRATISGKKLC